MWCSKTGWIMVVGNWGRKKKEDITSKVRENRWQFYNFNTCK